MGLERMRYLYNRFDNIVISFSGGKDSTAVLHLASVVAREQGKLPVKVNFFDEEAIHPPTIEYVERVRQREDIDLSWYCLPVKHRNACSNEQPYWHCWNPSEKHKWVRELPDNAITDHNNFTFGMSMPEFSDTMFDFGQGTFCTVTGVRTQESFRRMKAVSVKKEENYIRSKGVKGFIYTAHPIYDWSSEDVWKLVEYKGLDYNRTYDVFNKTRHYNKLLAQRVCPPYGEEPLRGLWLYAECFPELWHKMLYRVPGVATAWRYSNTELYGIGDLKKPQDSSWKEFTSHTLDTYGARDKENVKRNINNIIRRHYAKTNEAIPEEEVHPLTGTSWKFLAKLAVKGDMKGRTGPKLENEAIKAQKKLGINSYKEAQVKYGKRKNK